MGDAFDDGWSLCGPGVWRALGVSIDVTQTKSLQRGDAWFAAGDIDVLLQRSNGLCEITGIRFNLSNPTNGRRRPFLPSIDRIAHDKPYSLANCRIVCCCVNIALNDWGDEIFWTIVEAAWRRKNG